MASPGWQTEPADSIAPRDWLPRGCRRARPRAGRWEIPAPKDRGPRGPRLLAKFVNTTTITRVYGTSWFITTISLGFMVLTTIVRWGYEPTNITGRAHIVAGAKSMDHEKICRDQWTIIWESHLESPAKLTGNTSKNGDWSRNSGDLSSSNAGIYNGFIVGYANICGGNMWEYTVIGNSCWAMLFSWQPPPFWLG